MKRLLLLLLILLSAFPAQADTVNSLRKGLMGEWLMDQAGSATRTIYGPTPLLQTNTFAGSNATINDEDTFTLSAENGYVAKAILVVGQTYNVVVAGSISAGTFYVKDSTTTLLTGFGSVLFTAASTSFRLYGSTNGGVIDLTTLTLQRTDGKVPDTSGNGNNCDLILGPSYTNSRMGSAGSNRAVSLNGTTQYGQLANALSYSAFTMSIWINPIGVASKTLIDGRDAANDGIYLALDATTLSPRGYLNTNSSTVAASSITTGTWTHVAWTYTGSTSQMYINGAANGSPVSTTQTISTTNPGRIGANIAGGILFNGSIDNIRIWNRALSTDEITTLYKTDLIARASSLNKGLAGRWIMSADKAAGAIVLPDQTGNKAGAITGASWATGPLGAANGSLSFDGNNDVFDLGATGKTIKSIAFRIKADTASEQLVDLNGTQSISLVSNTVTATGFGAATIYVNGTAASTLAENTWASIIITDATGYAASAMAVGLIGANYGAFDMDEIEIWDRVLSADEIAVRNKVVVQ